MCTDLQFHALNAIMLSRAFVTFVLCRKVLVNIIQIMTLKAALRSIMIDLNLYFRLTLAMLDGVVMIRLIFEDFIKNHFYQ